MNNTFVAIIGSIITSLAAIIAPLIVQAYKSKQDFKKVKIQQFYKRKVDIFESLMDAFGMYAQDVNIQTEQILSAALNKAMLVCDKEELEEIHWAIRYIHDHDSEHVINCLTNLLTYISRELEITRQKYSNEKVKSKRRK